MFLSERKTHPILKVINNLIIDYPTPVNLSIWWNLGSLLGLRLVIQIIRGLFLAIFYVPDISIAFSRVVHISRDVTYGWLIRAIHANGASLFFVCIYLHIARGLYYFSFRLNIVWNVGVVIYIVLIATAFIGYVLPWGQIRFWGATVITRLLSAIPYVGTELVHWVWGGFAVDYPTLSRFFALHFILPFLLVALTIIHIIFLHTTGGYNPLGDNSAVNKIPIHPYYTTKDVLGFIVVLFLFTWVVMFYPNILGDPENFIKANPLITPLHIKPEWYFLWLYAILRRIPNKLGGVIAIFAAILVLLIFPFIMKPQLPSNAYYPISQIKFWGFITVILSLTWIGGCPVEYPFDSIGLFNTVLYFVIIGYYPLGFYRWDKFISK